MDQRDQPVGKLIVEKPSRVASCNIPGFAHAVEVKKNASGKNNKTPFRIKTKRTLRRDDFFIIIFSFHSQK